MRSTTERRYEILKYLCSRRMANRQELSYRFGVSLRTIERDLLVLEGSYPIYTMQGGGGGIYMMEGFKLGENYLSERQKSLLLRLMSKLSGEDEKTMREIIRTFSMPERKKQNGYFLFTQLL